MSPETEQPSPAGAPESESRSGLDAKPLGLLIVLSLVLYAAVLYLDRYGGGFHALVHGPYRSLDQLRAYQPRPALDPFVELGRRLYPPNCGICHQANGMGLPGFAPPLAGAEWVVEPVPARLIRIPLHGLTGPIMVRGQEWNLAMPPMGHLSDEEIAAILTYTRQAWGNRAPPVTPEQVEAVRQETASRTAPWTAAELTAIPLE